MLHYQKNENGYRLFDNEKLVCELNSKFVSLVINKNTGELIKHGEEKQTKDWYLKNQNDNLIFVNADLELNDLNMMILDPSNAGSIFQNHLKYLKKVV